MLDLSNLHPGIEHYYRGNSASEYTLQNNHMVALVIIPCCPTHTYMVSNPCLSHGVHPPGAGDRPHHRSSVKPLNLVHYTGSDRLAEVGEPRHSCQGHKFCQVMEICPKLRTFKLFVTESLSELGSTLATLGHSLEQVNIAQCLFVYCWGPMLLWLWQQLVPGDLMGTS